MYHAQEKIVNTPGSERPAIAAASTTRSPARC
jgi:nitrate reductase alpha subunit